MRMINIPLEVAFDGPDMVVSYLRHTMPIPQWDHQS